MFITRSKASRALAYRIALTSLCLALALVGVPRLAQADVKPHKTDYFGEDAAPSQEIRYVQPGQRSAKAWGVIGGLFGGAVLATAAGVYFHLDSRDNRNALLADGSLHTGRIYSQDTDARWHATERSRTRAIVGYSVAGGLAIAALVALFVTQPDDEVKRIDATTPGGPGARPVVVPIPSGGMLGGSWRF